MRRQFLRVYLGIAGVLLAAAFVILFVIDREIGRVVDQRLEDSMAPWVNRMRTRLRRAPDAEQRARMLERLSEPAPFAIRVVPLSEVKLSESDSLRLATGEPILVATDEGRMVYGQLDEDEVLALGPLPKLMVPRPLGHGPGPPRFEERGPAPMPLGPGPLAERVPFQGTYLLLGILLAILVLIGAAVYLLLRPFERRIWALADVARRFGEGELGARAATGRDDAIAALATAFNQMADRIGALIAQQRDLMRAVSHELRTPLARLFFLVDDAQSATDAELRNRHLQRIETSLQDLNGLVEELLTFVRLEGQEEGPEREQVTVTPVLREVAAVLTDLRPGLEVAVEEAGIEVSAVPRLFRRAVLNLATNAARHARTRVAMTVRPEHDRVMVVVDDDGPGIPPEARQRVFEPFFRLDESRSADSGGVGLGLAIVQRIMALHNGSIGVEDNPAGGARFVLSFPTRTGH
ncbi:MAG: ATP-binding protein [Candidatus Latescibacterota bacterium]